MVYGETAMSRREADPAARAAAIAEWKNRLIWLAIATAVLAVAILFRLQEGTPPAHAEGRLASQMPPRPPHGAEERRCRASAGRSTT